MTPLGRGAAALAIALVATGTGYAVAAAASDPVASGPGTITVEVGIDQSRFDTGDLRVVEGTLVEFVVRNDDPIDHELVVGNAAVHARHAEGSEQRHPPVPGEVSVAPAATALTYYVFNDPGTVDYVCHLPGHEAYGMRGTIEVIPTD